MLSFLSGSFHNVISCGLKYNSSQLLAVLPQKFNPKPVLFEHFQVYVSNSPFFYFQILARFSPLLLSGTEEELVKFLKDDDEAIKEGVLNVLAKAGGTIRENLAALSRFDCWDF